ncbi:flavin-containing monooxygenase [Actinomadura terrae]|uniref:flavin-containing monooxygenase n=1 Tax=Actinomadura terrae TaxID=604353 RepID=UPI001FA6D4D7|nr:NAD(P)/FAD-dependent oxidoreductase [Actinomadura terrae]
MPTHTTRPHMRETVDETRRRRMPSVLIIGAGISGICMAFKLKEAGIDNFTIIEKEQRIGGTWRDNTYPGLACDIPAALYQYSFELNPHWSHFRAPGAEIAAYLEDVVDRHGLRPHLRFGEEVTAARFADGGWRVTTANSSTFEVDFLISATGFLHHPSVPNIPGLGSFSGPLFHSAQWKPGVRIHDRRVALIGTGSSGVQLVAALAGAPRRLLVFQRTPQWIFPMPNWKTGGIGRALRRVPAFREAEFRLLRWLYHTIISRATVEPGWRRNLIGWLCRRNLRTVTDPELRSKLTPDYEPMCKRIVLANSFYRAVQEPTVDVITEPIDHIAPDGVVTADGVLHQVDVIITATGFRAHDYVRPTELVGAHGRTLTAAWQDGPRAYRTVALPDFPNFFIMVGPHSPVGHTSVTEIAETQADFALQWIHAWQRGAFTAAAPTRTATDEFYRRLHEQMPQTVWATGCRSWYLDSNGTPNVWPWRPEAHIAALSSPDEGDFELK